MIVPKMHYTEVEINQDSFRIGYIIEKVKRH